MLMVYKYFQNSVQLLANDLKQPFVLFVASKTQTEGFVGKWQIDKFGALFVENKD